MHIGITISLQSEMESLWINGIKLNALFLSKALQKTGHKVTILDTGTSVKDITQENVRWDLKEFPTENYSKVSQHIDMLIMLGTSFD